MSPSRRSSLLRSYRCIVLAHILFLCAFWLSNRLFFNSTNDYLAKMIGRPLDYVSALLVFYVVLGLWTTFLIFRPASSRVGISLAWIHSLLGLLSIGVFYGSFWLLFKESPIQIPRLGQLWMYFRHILDPIVLLLIALRAGLVLRRAAAQRTESKSKTRPAAFYLLPYTLLWVVTLVFPPHSVYRGPLPEKPQLVAHRGASMLAPENTLASAQLAADLGAYAYETDLRISADGQLFIMHDDTFARTTDVKTVFPGREKERVEAFSLSEISQLNAGKWFVDSDPFQSIARGWISPDQASVLASQHVPLFSQVIDVVRGSEVKFIFDLKGPPAGHPYRAQFFDIAFEQLHQAGIDSQVWFLADQAQLQVVKSQAPAMIPVAGVNYKAPARAGDLAAQGYQVVNVEYGLPRSWIRDYREAGLWVNVYTVDEPWQFSRLWISGVNSTTTNNLRTMSALAKPVLGMPYSAFVLYWIFIGAAGLAVMNYLARPASKAEPALAGKV